MITNERKYELGREVWKEILHAVSVTSMPKLRECTLAEKYGILIQELIGVAVALSCDPQLAAPRKTAENLIIGTAKTFLMRPQFVDDISAVVMAQQKTGVQ